MTAHVFRDGYDFTIAVECCNAMAAAGAFKQRLSFPQLVSYLEEFFSIDGKGVIQKGIIAAGTQRIQRGLAANTAARCRIEMPIQSLHIERDIII